jgi:hypothetical protein
MSHRQTRLERHYGDAALNWPGRTISGIMIVSAPDRICFSGRTPSSASAGRSETIVLISHRAVSKVRTQTRQNYSEAV